MTLSLDEVQKQLPELSANLRPGEQLTIDDGGTPVATITRSPLTSWGCEPGSAAHRPHWMAPDFDEPLDDFAEYMR
jgi:antitoxin (DNA-binding transcriptional repressor) of toxin-antitoxin stability system